VAEAELQHKDDDGMHGNGNMIQCGGKGNEGHGEMMVASLVQETTERARKTVSELLMKRSFHLLYM
jgi:hypothetical protein